MTTRDQLDVLVTGLIADALECDRAIITRDTLLDEELGCDSTELIGIIVDVEKALGTSLKAIDYGAVATPGDLVEAILAILKVSQAA